MCVRKVHPQPQHVLLRQEQVAVTIADPAHRAETVHRVVTITEATAPRQEVPLQAQAVAAAAAIAVAAVQAQVQAAAATARAATAAQAVPAAAVQEAVAAEEDNYRALTIV